MLYFLTFSGGHMKDRTKIFGIIKIAELVIFVVFELLFLITMLSNKELHDTIFTNRSLFFLCAVMYFTILFILAFMVYDFLFYRDFKIRSNELENLAYFDVKTGILSREGLHKMTQNFTTPESMAGIACIVTEISNIKEINASLGRDEGDNVIHEFSGVLEGVCAGYGYVCRNGGNEYVTLLTDTDREKVTAFIDKLGKSVDEYNENHEKAKVSIHSEYVLHDEQPNSTFSELISSAYTKLKG